MKQALIQAFRGLDDAAIAGAVRSAPDALVLALLRAGLDGGPPSDPRPSARRGQTARPAAGRTSGDLHERIHKMNGELSTQERVLKAIENEPEKGMSRQELVTFLRLTDNQVGGALPPLRVKKKIRLEGARANARWFPTN